MTSPTTGPIIKEPPYWWDTLPIGAVLTDYDAEGRAIFTSRSGAVRWRVDPWDDTCTVLEEAAP